MADRRTIVIGGASGLVAAAYGASWAPRLWEAPLELHPLAAPEGYRRLEGGPTSTGLDPLAGLAAPGETASPELSGELCTALFGAAAAPAGVVPVASFSDYNCPYCRVMTKRVAALADELPLRVRWHELPLLGEASVRAARAALAAARQERYAAFHERLMRTSFRPTPAYLRSLGDSVGLDTERMMADMDSEAVSERIRTSRAVAERFGVAGTPALVVGSTLVEGAVAERTLRRLIARERADGAGPCA